MLERNVSVTHMPIKNSFIFVPNNLNRLASGVSFYCKFQ